MSGWIVSLWWHWICFLVLDRMINLHRSLISCTKDRWRALLAILFLESERQCGNASRRKVFHWAWCARSGNGRFMTPADQAVVLFWELCDSRQIIITFLYFWDLPYYLSDLIYWFVMRKRLKQLQSQTVLLVAWCEKNLLFWIGVPAIDKDSCLYHIYLFLFNSQNLQ